MYKILIRRNEDNIQNIGVDGRKILFYCTNKINVTSCHANPGTEGAWRYSSNIFLISALEGGGWSTPNPAGISPGKIRYPWYGKLGG